LIACLPVCVTSAPCFPIGGRVITAYLAFPNWETLMTTIINSKPLPEIESQAIQ
jgi:hypothetical protein